MPEDSKQVEIVALYADGGLISRNPSDIGGTWADDRSALIDPVTFQKVKEYFYCRVAIAGPDECWIWQNWKDDKGYGGCYFNGRKERAHRLSWMLHNRSVIPADLVVRHKCDNPPCANPGHLLLGTPAQNTADMMERKRNAYIAKPKYGEEHGGSKLTSSHVRIIRHRLNNGDTCAAIAADFKVDRKTISKIKNKRTWAWMETSTKS